MRPELETRGRERFPQIQRVSFGEIEPYEAGSFPYVLTCTDSSAVSSSPSMPLLALSKATLAMRAARPDPAAGSKFLSRLPTKVAGIVQNGGTS